MRIYKICPVDEWDEAKRTGVYGGTKLDRGYGYIHLCTEEQIPQMIERYFSDADELMLVEINTDKIQRDLRYERARSGGLFPHLYDDLIMDVVVKETKLQRQADGTFPIP
jgi:uncharacterized protein (DUF952 family)